MGVCGEAQKSVTKQPIARDDKIVANNLAKPEAEVPEQLNAEPEGKLEGGKLSQNAPQVATSEKESQTQDELLRKESEAKPKKQKKMTINADLTLNGVPIYQRDDGFGQEFTAARFDERVDFALKGSLVKEIFIENITTSSDVWNTIIAQLTSRISTSNGLQKLYLFFTAQDDYEFDAATWTALTHSCIQLQSLSIGCTKDLPDSSR